LVEEVALAIVTRPTPYWQAGDALLPYGKDWITTGVLEVEGNRREGGLGGL